MNIVILGVGRSGTTIIYALIQKIMIDYFGQEHCKFIYEPFLRDIEQFNNLYEYTSPLFPYMDSLSAEGIYHHTKLPMLVGNSQRYDNSFLKNMFKGGDPNQHIIAKFIRLNGRYRQLEKFSLNYKSIFILRNPIDIANSIANKFSFYGGEFHRDDLSRFIDEVNKVYDTNYTKESFRTYLETQLFYWYYMNRFALESFDESFVKPLIIVYEDFQTDPQLTLLKIVEHLKLEYKDEYLELITKRVGGITGKKELSQLDYKISLEYYQKYIELLKKYNLYHKESHKDTLTCYLITNKSPTQQHRFYGYHMNSIKKFIHINGLFKTIKPKFAHIINPIKVDQSSDLFKAQPVTFQTMQSAKQYAEFNQLAIEQFATYFKEDRELVPSYFKETRLLSRSILDFGNFSKAKKLPFLADILENLYLSNNAEYLIYTNVDIALMPHFYVTLAKIIDEGYDAVTIFRRTLDDSYRGVEDIEYMYADLGLNHPGTDCFVFKRELFEKFDLQNIAIGAYFIALALRVNLYAFSKKIKEFDKLHMTFHIGDDRSWQSLDDFSLYNEKELDKIFTNLLGRNDIVNREKLKKLQHNFEERKKRLRERHVK